MSRKPSKKPKPRPSPTVFIANKQKAAIGQLESAILLWFNEADPISILVLASNAHDCYHALGKKIGKPSWHQEFMGKMPRSYQERARENRNLLGGKFVWTDTFVKQGAWKVVASQVTPVLEK